MKKIIVMAAAAILMLAGANVATATTVSAEAAAVKAEKKPKAEKKTVVFQTNIHCAQCAKKVRENISFEKGVTGLEIDEKTKVVTITYDSAKTSEEKLAAAINKLGYTAEVIK